jgi:cation transport regulator ChaC
MDSLHWVFGYGSLIWRPSFPFEAKESAYLEGFARRFWQGSTDHRGIVGAPGRVVTLVEEPTARTWGVAYRLSKATFDEILPALDHREKGGYARHLLPLYRPDGNVITRVGLVYVATESNENYLGPAPLEQIAAQVRGSVGPSGANIEYVLRLAEALELQGAQDEHVFALADLLRAAERS